MKKDGKLKSFLAFCIAPAVILFFIFMIVPTFNVFRMSLYEKGAYTPDETFVGLNNFKVLLSDAKFIQSMQNMILLVVVVTIITFAFALVFAGILSREKIKGQNLVLKLHLLEVLQFLFIRQDILLIMQIIHG